MLVIQVIRIMEGYMTICGILTCQVSPKRGSWWDMCGEGFLACLMNHCIIFTGDQSIAITILKTKINQFPFDRDFIVWPFRICWYKTGLCSPSKWCRGHNVSTLKGFRLEIFTKFYFVSLKFQHWIIAILKVRCEKITSLIRWWVAFKDTGAPVNPERLGEQKGAAKWTLWMEI